MARQKLVVPRALARHDVEAAIDSYLADESDDAALRFIEALERAYAHVGRYPASGSQRFAHELRIPDIRAWPLRRFPYVILYVERHDHVDVWRVLHLRRDIPAWMTEASDE